MEVGGKVGEETARPLVEAKGGRRPPSQPSILVVVASTAVAVAGSFVFGMSVGATIY